VNAPSDSSKLTDRENPAVGFKAADPAKGKLSFKTPDLPITTVLLNTPVNFMTPVLLRDLLLLRPVETLNIELERNRRLPVITRERLNGLLAVKSLVGVYVKNALRESLADGLTRRLAVIRLVIERARVIEKLRVILNVALPLGSQVLEKTCDSRIRAD
jgi:hypothetical protein